MSRTLYAGAGLGGLGIFGAGDLGAQTFNGNRLLPAIFYTTAFGAAVLFSFAYYAFEWEATKIQRDIADRVIKRADPLPASVGVPGAEKHFRAGVALLVAAGVTLLVAAWMQAIDIRLK